MRFVIGLSLTLLSLSACAVGSRETNSVSKSPPLSGNFCSIYKPVYVSRLDTEETKKAVDQNNAVWLELCNS